MNSEDIILSCECNEPEGKIVRSVKLCKLSSKKLGMFWERVKKFDTLFDDYNRGDFKSFVQHFIVMVDGNFQPAGLIWEVDDIGILMIHDIKPFESAQGQFIFWDGRFRGREEICRRMIKYVFDTYKFARIEALVPLYARTGIDAVERIGFSLEGRKRDAILYQGKWFDVNLYSMIPDDINGSLSYVNSNPQTNIICTECRLKFVKNRVKKPTPNKEVTV